MSLKPQAQLTTEAVHKPTLSFITNKRYLSQGSMMATTGMEIQADADADPDIQFHREMQQMADEIMDEESSEDEEDDSCQSEDEDIFHNLLASPEPHKDVHTMGITPQERQWALELKQAAKERSKLHELSDMEYTHYAIFSRGNHPDALKRMAAMQQFREEYQVDNSVEQGLFMLGEFMKQQEGLMLVLDVHRVALEGLHGFNIAALDPRLANEPCLHGVDYNWRIFVCGLYYYLIACQPCLGSVRAGAYTVSDFKNMGWKQANMEFHYRFAGRLHDCL
jgi:hypothetical protein